LAPRAAGVAPARDALAVDSDVAGFTLPEHAKAGEAVVARSEGARLDVRADGPGLLVVAEGYDAGWSAALDGRPARVVRVNHDQLGVALPEGPHRVTLRYRPRGFTAGLLLLGAGLVLLALGERVLASPVRVSSRA
jgi:uncharacterized membrane protein YfhO